MTSKLDIGLDDIIKKSHVQAKRGGGGGRGGRRGGRGGGGRGGGGRAYDDRPKAGGAQRGRRSARGNRSLPYRKGDPEDTWGHDMYDETQEGQGKKEKRADLGNTGFLKKSLAGGSERTTVEITNLSYDVSEDEVKELLGSVGDLIRAHVVYDNSGRSEGIAKAVFSTKEAALNAVREYDGVDLDGQAMSVAIVPNDPPRNKPKNKSTRGGPKRVGSFQVSQTGGRKVITRVRPSDDRAFL